MLFFVLEKFEEKINKGEKEKKRRKNDNKK